MKPEAQHIALLEALGWTKRHNFYWTAPRTTFPLISGGNLPPLTLDLMAEAEEPMLKSDDRSEWFCYVKHLQNACCGGNATHEDHVHASKEIRREAFLKTKGLWVDQ